MWFASILTICPEYFLDELLKLLTYAGVAAEETTCWL